ncbi:MAG: hypothetical protein WCV58_01895 [Patescibacteria group bacterium]
MMKFNQNKILSKITKVGVYLGVFWVLFLLGRAIWQNWDLKHSIYKLNEQIVILNQQKKDLENLNLYYQSDSFKELEARKLLGLKKSGEKLVILPIETPKAESSAANSFPEQLNKEKETVAGVTAPTRIPNWLLWWQYFTK